MNMNRKYIETLSMADLVAYHQFAVRQYSEANSKDVEELWTVAFKIAYEEILKRTFVFIEQAQQG